MNLLPDLVAQVRSTDPNVDLTTVVGTMVELAIGDDAGGVRTFKLLVTEARYAGSTRDGHAYELHLSVNAWLLTKRHGYRVFQRMSAQQIVDQVLKDAGMSPALVEWRLVEEVHERMQCVQYDEDEWAFITRLLADEGINFWFETTEDGDSKLIFGDSPQAHDAIEGKDSVVTFVDGSGMARSAASLFALTRHTQVCFEGVHLRDFDIGNPDVPIEGFAGETAMEWFEYPAWVPDPDTASARAKVRLEQLRRYREYAKGSSHCVRLQPGRVVTIVGVADEALNGHFLVESVAHSLEQATQHETDSRQYVNDVYLIPQDGETTHRPAIPRRRPTVVGIETAVVTGPSGEEIDVDELGRITVSHPWDRSGIHDDKSGRRVRTAQMNMGASMMLPRVGWEVPVAYRNGNPDKPRVLGRVYNGSARVPYPLPEKKATASLQSGTSPADGTTNELRLGDSAGAEEMMLHASGSQKIAVGGDAKTTIGSKDTYNVGGNFNEHIVGSQSITVSASQTIGVASGSACKIGGARVVSCGSENIGVDKNRVVDCGGAYIDMVGGLYFVRCNQHNEACAGSFVQAVGGLMGVAAGCGLNESVAGARIEVCGVRNVVTASFEDKAIAAKRITTAACSVLSGANKTAVKSTATIVAGATKFQAGGTLVISGTDVTVNAASLTRGGFTAAGSHTASGKVVHKGATAKHKGSTKAKT